MEDGAVGVSTSLIYPPAVYASTEELIELTRVAGEYGGTYFTHMRNESHALLAAIREAISIGAGAGVPVHIYHLEAAGEENWPLMAEALALIDRARSAGMDLTADIYPYRRNGIGLGSFLHPRHYADGEEAGRRAPGAPRPPSGGPPSWPMASPGPVVNIAARAADPPVLHGPTDLSFVATRAPCARSAAHLTDHGLPHAPRVGALRAEAPVSLPPP
jgi:hypothetical protein